MLRIGVDVGGTFTDFAAWRDDPATLTTYKVSSTPPNFIDGFKAGFEEIIARIEPRPGESVIVMHGTTVSTNTVIERNGSVLALLVTRGFRDILDLQRFRLNDPIRIDAGRTEPLVPRHLVFEIDERLEPNGSVHTPIDLAQVREAALAAKAQGATSIAIAFLHSYANLDHELAAAQVIADAVPEADVSISSEILPRIGEYERSIACVLNAYVRKRLATYIGEVEAYLGQRLAQTRLFITRSNGGALAAKEARNFPIHTLLSGPASGVTAARFFAAAEPERRFLTMDMGGTSTDMSLILDGRPTITNEAKVGDFPLTMTVTGIEAVGAGGGSVAWLDGTVLRVGPRSAGAWPGPACFGRGGTEPTVTDAYLLCGYIDPDNFLGGRMRLDVAAAGLAFAPLARRLGITIDEAAEACITVASSNMVAKALPYFARHGVDQEELTLVLFGGAGSLHGPLLAHELGINRLLVPRTPSVFCAFGGLVSELVQDMVATVYGSEFDGPSLARRFGDLEQGAETWLAAQAGKSDLVATRTEHWAEMRYLGQFFSLNVLLPPEAVASGDLAAIHGAYHAEHERLYSHADREAQIEILELRVRIAGALPTPAMDAIALPSQDAGISQAARSLRFDGTLYQDAPVHDRDTLQVGSRIEGPAIIEQSDTTIFVIPGFVAETQASGDLLMTRTN
ncbi:hydantoinase/oxoprolinase family protein [Bosea caraganae]|uniref:Hydantoinase/oxoprolinase family protein n=1 Tax=Bosea caraganae TaxID=2763117 RepID=A0A370LDB9_9HYPH|nr:hydantoinase/oxoprolinase family protein [Bosea caraganae]RDJ29931.1 hydantoinase/oxoprolinase family protein [Bosea caraganae]